MSNSTTSPNQPFFSTPQQRLALARQRYFDEGTRPSGLVSESVIQSWSRCVQAHRDPRESIAFNPVTPSRVHSALQRSELMLRAAADELLQLEQTLAGTPCTAILTDARGVVVHSTQSAADHGEVLLPLARRIGVNVDEGHIGTAAPGVTIHSGEPCLVLGGEHFFGGLQLMHCAAAPIHDVRGQLAAVLDLSCEGRSFGFDAAAIVAMYATTIENRLLRAQSTEHLVVQLQTSPGLIGTPMEGLAGIDTRGRIAWVNNAAGRLLGLAPAGQQGARDAEQVFGLSAARLAALTRGGASAAHRLPSGLNVWLSARLQSRDGAVQPIFRLVAAGEVSAPEAAPASRAAEAGLLNAALNAASIASTLRESDRELVARTVQACDGNVSKAARQLGVSRGLVYRHLKKGPKAAP